MSSILRGIVELLALKGITTTQLHCNKLNQNHKTILIVCNNKTPQDPLESNGSDSVQHHIVFMKQTISMEEV